MAENIELKASARDRVGKGAARATRREGLIPAVIYGDKKPPEPISLPYKEVWQQVQTGLFLSTVYVIDLGGKKTRVLPRDIQFDPIRDFPLHVDFLRVSKEAKITVEVPVHFINETESPGLKRGGVLNIVRHTIEMLCPVDSIPEAISVDLTGLDIGDSLHISSVKLPQDVVPTITDRDFTVVTIAGAGGGAEEEEKAEGEEGEEEIGKTPESTDDSENKE